jgi:hypothetical protein
MTLPEPVQQFHVSSVLIYLDCPFKQNIKKSAITINVSAVYGGKFISRATGRDGQ